MPAIPSFTAATASAISTTAAASAVTVSTTSAIITAMMTMTISFPSVPAVAQSAFLATDKVGVQVPLGQHFTLTDPYLDTDLTIYRQSKYVRIVDIHTQ